MRSIEKIAILFTISLALFMDVLDSNIINTAIPTMSRSFHISPVDLKIALISYLLSLAVFIPISGWTADKYGTKRIFIAALGVFTASSIACGYATSLTHLVIARCVQGIGGAFMMSLGRLIIARTFARHQLVQAMNIVIIVVSMAVMLGPYIGGVITDRFSWPWIFWVNIPAGIMAMLLAYFILKEDHYRDPRPFDKRGFFLFGGSLALLCFALSELSESNIDYSQSTIMIGISISMLIAYYFHAKRHPHPVIKLELFQIKTFRIAVFGNLFARLGFGGIPFLLPLMMQIAFGYSAELSGLLLVPMAFGIIASKLTGYTILQRLGYRRYLLLNTLLVGITLWLFQLVTIDTPVSIIALLTFTFGLVMSSQYTAMNSLALADIPPELLSFSNSITGTNQILAQSLGVAMGAILLRLYSDVIHDPLVLTTAVFHYVFITLGIITILSAGIFSLLTTEDGSAMLKPQES